MASTNIYKRFQALTENDPQIRAEVIAVDTVGSRVKVVYTGFNEWVSGSANVGDSVLVQSGVIITTLPSLPYLSIEV